MQRFALPILLLACTGPDDEPALAQVYSDCDPLVPDYCALPYPSSFYQRADASTATGWRVHLGAETLPVTRVGLQPDPFFWNELDGFSPLGPILTRFSDLSVENLPGHDDIGASLADESPIVLFDADTGERHPFFAELDVSGERVVGREFLFIRPVTPMINGHRYIVALRDLVDTNGGAIAPSEAFVALRDGGETPTPTWDVEGRRDLYEDIFTRLEGQGWSRGETVLAWDFVVASTDKITGRAVWMRDDALAAVGQAGPAYVIDAVTDDVSDHVWRQIQGTMTVPLYTEEDKPGTVLTRDASGMPYRNGETSVPFTIRIPRTAQTDPRPLKLLQYGHGLLGAQDEVESGYLGEMADRYGYILFAVDWTGMKSEDADGAEGIPVMIVSDISRFPMIPERTHQGFVEFVCAAQMMQGAMASDANLAIDGVSLVDPSTVWYYGNSQGAILGGAYLALSSVIERGVLGVGGAPYSLLLSRSADFTPFFGLFQGVYPDQEDISFWMALMQNAWDSGEAGGYGRQMVVEPLPGTPPKQVLLQDAIGDAQVTTLGAHVMARAYGASLVETPIHAVWGLDTQPSGFTGSALVEYEHGAPEVPYTNLPPDAEYDTHEDTRRTLAAQDQLDTFFTTGTVVSYCDGGCDPE